jgi:hypothetical protein
MWHRLRRIFLICFSIEDMTEALMNPFDRRSGRAVELGADHE